MQDNKDIANIDEQFTDLGWEKMQGILHKEMPVTPVRKRRWGWLLLLLFFGIMAGGTYYNFAIKKATSPIEIPNTSVADVIDNTNDIDKFEKNNEATTPRTDDFPESSDGTGSRREKPNPATAKVVVTNSPKISTKKEVEKNIIQNNLHIIKENNFTAKKTHIDGFPKSSYGTDSHRTDHMTAKVVSTDISEKSLTEKTKSSSVIPTQSSSGYAKRIATLSPQITKNNNTIPLPSPNFDPIPKARKFSQTYSAFAGVRSDEFTGFGGFNVGLLAHYRFTPKVGLETGLMYSNTRKNIRANIDYTNAVNQLYPDNMLQYSSDIEDIHNYNYFRLPLSLTYRPYNKIQFSIGLNGGYRFDNIIENLGLQDDMVIVNTESNQADSNYESEVEVNIPADVPLTLNELERITVPYSLAVRRIDVAAQAGLRYYPIPRLGIDLNYQYGLLNMTKNTNINRNSGLQLALVYQLHK